MKWFDLCAGLFIGLGALLPPNRPQDIGGAIIAIGFLVSFVMRQMYG